MIHCAMFGKFLLGLPNLLQSLPGLLIPTANWAVVFYYLTYGYTLGSEVRNAAKTEE